jgi:hypothetical protein
VASTSDAGSPSARAGAACQAQASAISAATRAARAQALRSEGCVQSVNCQ